MRKSDKLLMERRNFLRAGALLGVGAGTYLATRSTEALAAERVELPDVDPVGAFGDSPSRAVELGRRPSLAYVNTVPESPDVILKSSGVPQVLPQSPSNTLAAATQQLYFRNTRGVRIWICISFPSKVTCAGWGDWGTRGWWSIDFAQIVHVLNTGPGLAYYYAESESGTTWSGTEYSIYAPQTAFDSCSWNHRIGDRELWMRPVALLREDGVNVVTF